MRAPDGLLPLVLVSAAQVVYTADGVLDVRGSARDRFPIVLHGAQRTYPREVRFRSAALAS